MENYEQIYREALRDNEAFWLDAAAAIDDPIILEEIGAALNSIGYAAVKKA